MHAHTLSDGPTGTVVVVVLLLAAVAAYIGPAVANRRRRPWPAYRCALWAAGVVAIGVSVLRPGAEGTPDFVQHMVDHLLLGMLAPLLLAAAAPMTLALRCLHPLPARRLSRLLRSPPLRLLSHPATALLLNVGGLWVLYTTGVYPSMHGNPLLLLAVHAHFLLAGYLFTAAVIGVDPTAHRSRYAYRAVILGIGLAAHGALSKHLYGHPPIAAVEAQVQQGSMLMYYVGDVIDAVLIVVVCAQWFQATRPRVFRHSPSLGVSGAD
jgi:putative membrane protein